jgi:hypothetical protein
MCVKESFLGFAKASSTTGEELATTIMTKLREYGIVTQTSVVSSAITLKQLAELHSETITCCNCLPQMSISSFCMVGDRDLAFGIVTQAMRGQGYDGAANMVGKFSGVRTRIQTEIPEAYYVHCYAHCLNLAVVKSCQLPIVN